MGSPQYYRVVRLTNDQWTNSVQTVLGLPSKPTNAESFQNAVSGMTDFTNNELAVGAVDSRGWSDYQAAAETIAKQVTSDSAQLSKLYSGTDGAGFIAAVGRRIYRRPLTTAETASYQKLFDAAASYSGTLSTFAKGAGVVLEAMLQSPHFLYRTELGAAGAPLSSYEMASKLSLWLRNSAPDSALLDSAAGGSLDTPDGAAAAAQKMLEEPAAKAVMRKFHGEFLHFDRYANLSKVGVAGYDPAINEELAESSYLFFDKIFSQGLGLKDVFLSTKGFVGPKMAALYGGGAAAPVSGFAEQELGSNRPGYFLQVPFLTLYAHNDEPDSIHRGVSISLDVLCSVLGPPAGTIPPLPARMPGQTNRMRVDAHTNGCGSICHNQIINPLGFAFENFDGMGQFQETETHGTEVLPIDASGAFNFVEGKKSYNNAAELMQVLSTDQQAHLCYSKKLADYALQRSLVQTDMPLITELATVSKSEGGSVKKILVDLVKKDAFRVRSGGAQ
jgi:Protein of unknown function (DUF1592)/Protein of unknown function (DUF1588)/Protein of unknown function (DUF1595)/Protein of unknown function (DUF1585)/Protein of unknown function (DUF1587)